MVFFTNSSVLTLPLTPLLSSSPSLIASSAIDLYKEDIHETINSQPTSSTVDMYKETVSCNAILFTASYTSCSVSSVFSANPGEAQPTLLLASTSIHDLIAPTHASSTNISPSLVDFASTETAIPTSKSGSMISPNLSTSSIVSLHGETYPITSIDILPLWSNTSSLSVVSPVGDHDFTTQDWNISIIQGITTYTTHLITPTAAPDGAAFESTSINILSHGMTQSVSQDGAGLDSIPVDASSRMITPTASPDRAAFNATSIGLLSHLITQTMSPDRAAPDSTLIEILSHLINQTASTDRAAFDSTSVDASSQGPTPVTSTQQEGIPPIYTTIQHTNIYRTPAVGNVPAPTSTVSTELAPPPTTLYSLATTTTSSTTSQCTSTLTYAIQAGDTFNQLASSFGISVSSIEAANPNDIPTLLQIGAPLTIPGTCASLYTIQAGDTFNFLSAQFGIDVAILEAANPNDIPTDLQIGATLIIPGPGPGGVPKRWYIIKAGDTFNSIAAAFGVDVTLLEAANPDDVPTDLQIGSILLIPDAVSRKLKIRSAEQISQLAMLDSMNATSFGRRLTSPLEKLVDFWKRYVESG